MKIIVRVYERGETYHVGPFEDKTRALLWARAKLKEPDQRYDTRPLMNTVDWELGQ